MTDKELELLRNVRDGMGEWLGRVGKDGAMKAMFGKDMIGVMVRTLRGSKMVAVFDEDIE